ncbi:MAG: hypothetical protein J3K34DRAFT_399512 [Monoraphidium minutum]|nr:MAG: hypothetical protein J3K34DRAFT_399512 [Monoraphidium minutum]
MGGGPRALYLRRSSACVLAAKACVRADIRRGRGLGVVVDQRRARVWHPAKGHRQCVRQMAAARVCLHQGRGGGDDWHRKRGVGMQPGNQPTKWPEGCGLWSKGRATIREVRASTICGGGRTGIQKVKVAARHVNGGGAARPPQYGVGGARGAVASRITWEPNAGLRGSRGVA